MTRITPETGSGQLSAFRPFETCLDRDHSLSILQAAARGGDDGEIFLERTRTESIVFDDGRVKSASSNRHEGFGLRIVRGETTGYAHANTLTEHALTKASTTARLAVQDGGGTLAPSPTHTNRKLYTDQDPHTSCSFARKVELMQAIDAYARSLDSRIVQATASLTTSYQEIEILRVDGQSFRDCRPMSRINVAVIIDANGKRESGYSGTGGRITTETLMDPSCWQALTTEALRIAAVNLDAEPAPAGVVDVVLGPGWPGILLHEAIGHGLEGDFNRKGTSAFAGLMGQRIASPGVTVLDDGTLPDQRGSISIDDEGTTSQPTPLIEDGILTGYMQDRMNARLMNTAPTGNGRRQSYAHAPMPRMTNTYMLAGDQPPDSIIADLRDGIHAVGFGGGQVDITNGKFVFSCTEAYRIRNGRRIAPVKNATLIGDGPTVL
ncbi:MAG: metallopeptidase TldD-related protein, partial [Rhodobacteraceae bacterium]|nr:metallopeptidase TldD-related protein [Paracoccaceae bacterium]